MSLKKNVFGSNRWHGCECYCDTPKGRISEVAWVRNFEGSYASPITIVRNIAELLVLHKAAIINEIQTKKPIHETQIDNDTLPRPKPTNDTQIDKVD